MQLAQLLQPDVVIMDMSMPTLNGLEGVRQIHSSNPHVSLVVLSMHDSEEMVRAALKAGARGYVLKSDLIEQLAPAVEAMCDGRLFFSPGITKAILEIYRPKQEDGAADDESPGTLTSRQLEVLRLLAQGLSNKEVARTLGISIRTVEAHRQTVMHRLRLRNLSELVLYAVRKRLIEPDDLMDPR